MAKRYSGNLTITLTYRDRGSDYAVVVTGPNKTRWTGVITPPRAGFGGAAYDSAKAYTSVAKAAISFAEHEIGDGSGYIGNGGYADSDDRDYVVSSRKPRRS